MQICRSTVDNEQVTNRERTLPPSFRSPRKALSVAAHADHVTAVTVVGRCNGSATEVIGALGQQPRGRLRRRDPGAARRQPARCPTGRSSRCSVPTAPARPPCCGRSAGLLDVHDGEVTKGAITLDGDRIAPPRPASRSSRRGVSPGDGGPADLRRAHASRRTCASARTPTRKAAPTSLERVFDLFPRAGSSGAPSTAGYLSGGEQQMLAMGRALMAQPALPAARRAEPGPGAAAGRADPRPDRARSTDRAPAVLLVEQNATMALSIAYARLRAWRPARSCWTSRRPSCSPTRTCGSSTSGLRPEGDGEVLPRRQALQAAEAVAVMTERRAAMPPSPSSRSSRRRAPVLRRRQGRSTGSASPSAAQRAVRHHRPERRRQDLDLQRALRRLPAAARAASSSTARTIARPPAAPDRRRGHGPHLPEHRALREPDRARQPDARPAHAPAATARSRRSPGSGRARRAGARRTAPRSRTSSTSSSSSSGARLPGGPAALRRAEAGRARPGAGDAAQAAAARRAGGRHEPRGDRGHGPLHPRHPRRAGHPDHPGRARHGPGHGPRRPGAWSSTSACRSRPALPAEIQKQPRRDPRLPRERWQQRHDARVDAPPHARAAAATQARTDAGHDRDPGPGPGPDHAPADVALREKDLGVWQEITWASYWDDGADGRRTPCSRSASSRATGSRSTRRTGREWLYTDVGARSRSGATTVGLYPTNPAAEVGYLLAHSGAKVLVAEDQEQVDKALAVHRPVPGPGADRLRRAARHPRPLRRPQAARPGRTCSPWAREHRAAHPGAVEERMAQASPRTSPPSSTPPAPPGRPRARCSPWPTWSSRSRRWSTAAGFAVAAAGPDDLILSYLPLCHVAERIFTTWFNAGAGVQVNFAESIDTVQPNLREVQPTILFGVPRIWEKHPRRGPASGCATRRWLKRLNARLWLKVADARSATTLVAHRRPAHASARGCSTRSAGSSSTGRCASGSACAGCATPRSGAAPIAPEVLQVLHGHRRADARGLRDDREHRDRHRQPARAGASSARSASRTPASSCASTRRPARSSPGTPAVFVGYFRDPEATARGARRRRLAAHRRRRRVGRRHAPADHRPDQGHHHHRGRQEHRAVARSRTRSRPRPYIKEAIVDRRPPPVPRPR